MEDRAQWVEVCCKVLLLNIRIAPQDLDILESPNASLVQKDMTSPASSQRGKRKEITLKSRGLRMNAQWPQVIASFHETGEKY